MTGNTLTRSRRRFGWGAMVAGGLAMAWWAAPGLPVWRAPRASADTRAAGRSLFEHEWEPADALAHGDGLGPVFNARSCAACHFQGGIGGGGGNDHNVMAFEAMPTKDRPEVEGGLIHKFAVANTFLEDHEGLRRFYPIVPGGLKVVGNCQILTRDLDPIRTESVNSTALFGAGWVDRISARSITHQSLRKSLESITAELGSKFDGIPTGRYRVLPDGRVGKFGWKGQFASLEEFVAAACANEVGLGNPMRPQAKPRVEVSYPDVAADLDRTQFGSLVAFVATLDRPVERLPEGTIERDQAARGSALFRQIGCAHCHTPDMGAWSAFTAISCCTASTTGPKDEVLMGPRSWTCRCPRSILGPMNGRRRRCGAWRTPPRTSTMVTRRRWKRRSSDTTAARPR